MIKSESETDVTECDPTVRFPAVCSYLTDYMPGRHILENYTKYTRVFGVEVVYFLRKYTVYFPCNSRVPTEVTRNTREIATPQWRNDGEISLIC